MKRILILLALALLCSCSKEKADEKRYPDSNLYQGTVSVYYEEEYFDNEDIKVRYIANDNGETASIVIYRIRFVPKMPVTIDVTIPDISVAEGEDGITMHCDEVIPLALGGEYPKYIVTDFTGTLSGEELEFSLNFGDYPTLFKGKLTE